MIGASGCIFVVEIGSFSLLLKLVIKHLAVSVFSCRVQVRERTREESNANAPEGILNNNVCK